MQLTVWKPVSILPLLALLGVHWISVFMPAKLPKFTSAWQPLYMEFNLDNVLQHKSDFKAFLWFVQPLICVMPESAYSSALNTHHQREEVPSAPQFLIVKCNMSKTPLVKCNMSKTLNVCSMWLALSGFRPLQGWFLVVLFACYLQQNWHRRCLWWLSWNLSSIMKTLCVSLPTYSASLFPHSFGLDI